MYICISCMHEVARNLAAFHKISHEAVFTLSPFTSHAYLHSFLSFLHA